MIWVLVGFGALFLMLRFPLFGVGVLLVAAAGAIYIYQQDARDEARRRVLSERALSSERIKYVSLQNSKLRIGDYYADLETMAANKSAVSSISKIVLRVVVFDCPDASKENCSIVGDVTEDVLVSIPPLQKRAITRPLYFKGLPKLAADQWSWDMAVAQVWAEP